MGAAEEALDVAAGDVRELLTALERMQVSKVTHGPEQGHAQSPGADTGLNHAGAGEDVGHRHDLGGILGIDHRGASRHREDVVTQQRTNGEILDTRGVLEGGAVRRADEIAVLKPATMGVERLAGLQGDGVKLALGIGQLDALALGERSPAQVGSGGLRGGRTADAHDGQV